MKTVSLRLLTPAFVATACLFSCLPLTAHAQLPSQLYAEAVQASENGNNAEAKRKLQLALQVDKNFRPASELLQRITLGESRAKAKPDGPAPVSQKTLSAITFPVEFKNTSLETALEYIRQQVEAKTGGKAQANFVMQLPPELVNRKITLTLNHVPVGEILRYIGDLAGVSFKFQPYAIAVVPAQPAGADAPAVPAPTP